MFKEISIDHGDLSLKGHLSYHSDSKAWIIFAHGAGSSRKSSRNNWVAEELNNQGYATLLFDLLSEKEDEVYANRFNIPLLSDRLITTTEWLVNSDYYHGQPIVYFGASTGAAAALMAAANIDPKIPITTIISRGGRPDLAGHDYLKKVSIPVLLIVGDQDFEVIKLNRMARFELKKSELVLVPGATHLFEEPGALHQVVNHVLAWLNMQLPSHLYEHRLT
jgi:putative phosphoribosyl transferase